MKDEREEAKPAIPPLQQAHEAALARMREAFTRQLEAATMFIEQPVAMAGAGQPADLMSAVSRLQGLETTPAETVEIESEPETAEEEEIVAGLTDRERLIHRALLHSQRTVEQAIESMGDAQPAPAAGPSTAAIKE